MNSTVRDLYFHVVKKALRSTCFLCSRVLETKWFPLILAVSAYKAFENTFKLLLQIINYLAFILVLKLSASTYMVTILKAAPHYIAT